MKEDTKLWVKQAEEDFKTAKAMLESRRYGYTCFCSQQALEKILKATVIELTNKRPAKTHDLIKLLEDSTLKLPQKRQKVLEEMGRHYFRVRYPDMHKGFYTTPKVAKETFTEMEEIFQWIKKKLN